MAHLRQPNCSPLTPKAWRVPAQGTTLGNPVRRMRPALQGRESDLLGSHRREGWFAVFGAKRQMNEVLD